jgi:OOP family OmpA-OmpF porin
VEKAKNGIETWNILKPTLLAKGWTVAVEPQPGRSPGVARYSRDGLDAWAVIDVTNNRLELSMVEVAPLPFTLTLTPPAAVPVEMAHPTRATSPKPASDGVLQQVAALLAKDTALKIEVQGHTDNVGGDTYNQTLSEARARAVSDWLTQHGVAAPRLSAHGYGKTKPVADNNNDEGRAKNRRVEIADPACAPAPAKP